MKIRNFLFCMFAVASACGDSSGNDDGHGSPDSGAGVTLPSPALVIANGGSSAVEIVDPATLKVVKSFPVDDGMHPHHLGRSPDGSRLLVTAMSADLSAGHGAGHAGHGGAGASTMVYQLDIASGAFTQVISVDATAHNAAFTKDGKTIVLAMMEHGMLASFDATTFKEGANMMGFEMPLEVTVTHEGTLLVAESGAARVALVDFAAQKTLQTFPVETTPIAAWASGGNDYYVSCEEGMKVNHLIESGATVAADGHVIDPGRMPGQAMLTPDGKELWVAIEDLKQVLVYDAASHAKLATITAGTKPHGIAFEPSGKRAFVTDEDGGQLLVIDVATHKLSAQLELGGKPNGIAWVE